MAITILPDAQDDLLSLQEYMLDQWTQADWLKAEDEIFEKLKLVDTGFLTGAPVPELASVGVFAYQCVFTSHHKLVYRRIDGGTYLYAAAGHRQDFPTLLMKRLMSMRLP
jgi:plasmid stabilization system protein ParE